MDPQLKGIILNHTLKAFKITPLREASVIQVTVDFYWGINMKASLNSAGIESGDRMPVAVQAITSTSAGDSCSWV